MAYYGQSGSSPRERDPGEREHALSHRISVLSDITDFNGGYAYDPHPAQPIRARESLVSLQSYDGGRSGSIHSVQVSEPSSSDLGHPYSTTSASSWTGSFSYSGGSRGYEPVALSGGSPSTPSTPSRASSRTSRKPSFKRVHQTIAEEYDLSLLSSASPMGTTPYAPIPENEPVEHVYDVTASLGPWGSQDAAFLKKLQEEEANGRLTGGLGAGIKPEATVRHADLLSTPSGGTQMSLGRSLSRRLTDMGRSSTIKGLGQDEANRRGEVIEVIMEEPGASEVDLSVMVGPNTLEDGGRSSTFRSVKRQETQIFYPQPNWKPFSMRWPYLLSLTVLSIGLAVMQEFLYQRSRTDPLLKFHSPSDVPALQYVAVKFLPTFLSVAYGVLWQVTDFEVKRLEAFYQLSKEGGALAGESINVDYITSINLMRPIHAFRLKHYAVAISSIATTLAVSLVPTFGAASIFLSPERHLRAADPNGEKAILVHPIWSRFLSATLCTCAFLGCALFYLLQTRRSGLLADVKGIAGLASMAVVSHMLMDFKDMDTAKPQDIHHKLKHHRYVLRNSALAPDDENPVSTQDRDKFQRHHLSENPHPLMLRAAGSIPFIIGILLFLCFIPVFLFTPATVVTDKAPWVVTALAVCIKLSWGSMETDVRMMEPYYILSRRHAPSLTLTLDYTAMPFGYLPFRAFLNRHFLVFFVGLGTVIAEILTVLLTSLATVEGRDFIGLGIEPPAKVDGNNSKTINSGQETVLSFWVSMTFVILILLYMAIVATVVFIRRRHPFLPRQPNTIASVLAFIHQSKMLYTFVGTAKLSNAGMVRKLEEMGNQYGLGWFEGRDGQTHCGVDQEELISNYKHGIDYSQGNKPWNTQWEVF
jgi:hypothetical protein